VPDIVLFDLDGTLTDAAPGIVNCLKYALDDMGIEPPDETTLRSFLGPPLDITFREYFGLTPEQSRAGIAKYRERYHDVGELENAVYPGIPEVLAQLTASGATLAVSTSKPTVSATRILEHFELAPYFSFIGGAALDTSRDSKALVIAHTLESLAEQGLDVPAASKTMVGDREHDVKGAAEFGIPTIGVLWGYGSQEELAAAGAAALVDSPEGLTTALRR
jgi:phosphoglycolate phosphatase